MRAVVQPHPLKGRAEMPSSKSFSHRLLIAAALSKAPTAIFVRGENDDIAATVRCLNALGAKIERTAEGYSVQPAAGRGKAVLDCGESGSTLRFLLPAAAALGRTCAFEGRGRLPERPHEILIRAMQAHGVCAEEGWPLCISGKLRGGTYPIAGNVSSQYITGLLMALPLCEEDSEIVLTSPLESAAYVDVTLQVLENFGICTERTDGGWRVFGRQEYRTPGAVSAEGDWSGAAFWLAANAMGMEVECGGLNPQSVQPDRRMGELLEKIGGKIDVSGSPDLTPALAIAAAKCPAETKIVGASRLRLKESDRLRAIADLLRGLGAAVREDSDGLTIRGNGRFSGGAVNGCRDHRIVMAAAIAGAAAEGPVTISDAEAVDKSYPDFFETFRALGGKVHVESDR